MTMKVFKVETETLELIDAYLKTHADGVRKISDVISKSIITLNEAEIGKHDMLEATSVNLTVIPKSDFLETVSKKYGKTGPYKVRKTVKSFAQVNSDYYTLEGSENLYPTEWFNTAPAPLSTPKELSTGSLAWIVMAFIFGYVLSAMQVVYFIMLI